VSNSSPQKLLVRFTRKKYRYVAHDPTKTA
jgi:hypothetical protein